MLISSLPNSQQNTEVTSSWQCHPRPWLRPPSLPRPLVCMHSSIEWPVLLWIMLDVALDDWLLPSFPSVNKLLSRWINQPYVLSFRTSYYTITINSLTIKNFKVGFQESGHFSVWQPKAVLYRNWGFKRKYRTCPVKDPARALVHRVNKLTVEMYPG